MTPAAKAAQQVARARWERVHGLRSDPEQWDCDAYRAAYPGSARGDDAYQARNAEQLAATAVSVPRPAGEQRWRLDARGDLKPLVPFGITDREAPAERGPAQPGSCPVAGSATPVLLDRCPRPVRVYRRLRDLVTGEHWRVAEPVDLPCMTKRCEFCSVELRRRYVGHFVHALKALPFLRFVTLTVDPKIGVPVKDSRKYLLWCWQKFRKRVNRRCEAKGFGPFVFVGTLEEHESGYFHLHVLCSAPLDDDELRTQAFASKFGAVCDVQLLSDAAPDGEEEANELARLVGYCMSYACKDAASAPNRRSIVNSENLGYHSLKAQSERAAYVAKARALPGEAPVCPVTAYFEKRERATHEREARFALIERARAIVARSGLIVPFGLEDVSSAVRITDEEWLACGKGRKKPSGDVLTSEDRKRFRLLSREAVTFTYRERRRKELIIVTHTFDRDTGQHTAAAEPWDGLRGRASNNG